MKNQELYYKIEARESISERQEIKAPANYVSVFHETKEEFLPQIDQEGLKVNSAVKNIGDAETVMRRNKIFDDFRPDELKTKGISRTNIYAYPFLEYGSGLMGADSRYIKRDEQDLRNEFYFWQEHKHENHFLEKLGVSTPDEYIKKVTSPEYLKAKYPGEVIEIKVDPQKCYVGDLEYFTLIMDYVRGGAIEKEATQLLAQKYWNNLITLENFLKWYRKPEFAEDGNTIKDAEQYKDGEPFTDSYFFPIKGTPDNFPYIIRQPEILIPEDIPQNHIKLVK